MRRVTTSSSGLRATFSVEMVLSLRQMFRDVRGQKLRTFLTVLGIVWGTVAVSLLLAFGKGFHQELRRTSAGLGRGIDRAEGGSTACVPGPVHPRLVMVLKRSVACLSFIPGNKSRR